MSILAKPMRRSSPNQARPQRQPIASPDDPFHSDGPFHCDPNPGDMPSRPAPCYSFATTRAHPAPNDEPTRAESTRTAATGQFCPSRYVPLPSDMPSRTMLFPRDEPTSALPRHSDMPVLPEPFQTHATIRIVSDPHRANATTHSVLCPSWPQRRPKLCQTRPVPSDDLCRPQTMRLPISFPSTSQRRSQLSRAKSERRTGPVHTAATTHIVSQPGLSDDPVPSRPSHCDKPLHVNPFPARRVQPFRIRTLRTKATNPAPSVRFLPRHSDDRDHHSPNLTRAVLASISP